MHQPVDDGADQGKVCPIRIANLYLYHVIAFVKNIKVKNAEGLEEEASELVMRSVEDVACIREDECSDLRTAFVRQLRQYRMDLLYNRFGFVFEKLSKDPVAQEWLAKYPNVLPLEV